MNSRSEDSEPRYRLRRGDDPELVEAEVRLLQRLSKAVDRAVGRDATPKERRTAFAIMVERDAEMAALVDRLDELSQCHSNSVFEALVSLGEKEATEEERVD
jgi:hypothetical protein